MRTTKAKGSKETFWNKLRIKNSLRIKDVAEMLGISIGTIGSWFSGQSVPNADNVKIICKLFEVPYDKGYGEFILANQKWDLEKGHRKISMYSPETIIVDDAEGTKKAKKTKAKKEKPQTEVPQVQKDYTKIVKYLYGRLSFADYMQLQTYLADNVDPMPYLYGKVSFDEYVEVMSILNG